MARPLPPPPLNGPAIKRRIFCGFHESPGVATEKMVEFCKTFVAFFCTCYLLQEQNIPLHAKYYNQQPKAFRRKKVLDLIFLFLRQRSEFSSLLERGEFSSLLGKVRGKHYMRNIFRSKLVEFFSSFDRNITFFKNTFLADMTAKEI